MCVISNGQLAPSSFSSSVLFLFKISIFLLDTFKVLVIYI